MNYEPKNFILPENGYQYLSTFGKCEWEMVAAKVVEASQKNNKWVSAEEVLVGFTDIAEMIECGWLEKTVKGSVLSESALNRLFEKGYFAGK